MAPHAAGLGASSSRPIGWPEEPLSGNAIGPVGQPIKRLEHTYRRTNAAVSLVYHPTSGNVQELRLTAYVARSILTWVPNNVKKMGHPMCPGTREPTPGPAHLDRVP